MLKIKIFNKIFKKFKKNNNLIIQNLIKIDKQNQ